MNTLPEIEWRKTKKIKYPVKRTINLIGAGEKPIRIKIAAPAILLIVFIAAIFSKFAVVDRLIAVSRAEAKVSEVQQQLNAGYDKIDSYGELTETYAHYTYSGMTEEELAKVDRTDVLHLMERVVFPYATVSSWSISGNEMTIMLTGSTLQKINTIVQELEKDDMVDYCTVTTAMTNSYQSSIWNDRPVDEDVTAQVTIYFKAMEEDE